MNIVTGLGSDAGDALVTHPGVRRLAFIGSAAIGRSIQARAATHVIKVVTLELGGKNPIVVFPDADLDRAVDGALRGMNFTWQGQSCGSTSRLLVHHSNDVSMHFPGTPYGGVKDSGVGREESLEELLSYTQTKNVNVLFDLPGTN